MLHRNRIAGTAVAAALAFTIAGAAAFDDAKYPDWSGLWTRPKGLLTQWDPGAQSDGLFGRQMDR